MLAAVQRDVHPAQPDLPAVVTHVAGDGGQHPTTRVGVAEADVSAAGPTKVEAVHDLLGTGEPGVLLPDALPEGRLRRLLGALASRVPGIGLCRTGQAPLATEPASALCR